METHPIPQQISSYQFRLVGDMTLKQFFQVGGGALVSLIIYSTHLHPFLKWPLIIFSFSLGAGLAFLPFEERPLSKWIFSFFRSVYSPTLYFWKRTEKVEVFFQEEAPAPKVEGVITPHGEASLEEYLKTLPETKKGFFTRLEIGEQNVLNKIGGIFSQLGMLGKEAKRPVAKPPSEEALAETKPEVPQKQGAKIPEARPAMVTAKGFRPKIVIEEKPLKEEILPKPEEKAVPVSPTLTAEKIAGQQAQFSPEAAPPLPPSIPNTIVGQVLDENGKIVEGAILEIKDLAGRPVRALRSNKVGHFLIVTSLPNGEYEIITEKEGLYFEPVSFVARGEVIPPIAIKASTKAN